MFSVGCIVKPQHTASQRQTDRQHYDAAMLMQYDQLKLTRRLSTLDTRKYKKENMFTWCS